MSVKIHEQEFRIPKYCKLCNNKVERILEYRIGNVLHIDAYCITHATFKVAYIIERFYLKPTIYKIIDNNKDNKEVVVFT